MCSSDLKYLKAVFSTEVITCRDHEQYCLKSAKRLRNTSGYSPATGYSFRICKGQQRSCRSMKGVRASSHSPVKAKETPPPPFFCCLKKPPNFIRYEETLSQNLLSTCSLKNCYYTANYLHRVYLPHPCLST